MDINQLTEVDQEQIVREQVTAIEQRAFVARIADKIGTGTKEQATQLTNLAVGARKAAKKRDVEGPYLTPDARVLIVQANESALERAFIEAELNADAGNEDADPDAIADQLEKLRKIDPKTL